MLTTTQISDNKKQFIHLLESITRPGADIIGLIKKLEASDFFTAPASTVYHACYEGGLCAHSLNVFDQIVKLVLAEYPEISADLDTQEAYTTPQWEKSPISYESLIIVSLLHDISKMNFYKTDFRNVKDESGQWTRVPYIAVKPAADRFLYSTHGVNSQFMVQTFIPLSIEESTAIINHMGATGENVGEGALLSQVYNKYPLAILLHSADMLATFLIERI